MDDQELEILLDDLESDRVERKSSIAEKDKICEAICAFANDLPNHQRPGVLFIGINDNGTCAQLPINDRLLLTLADLRSNGNILPFPCITVQKRKLKGCEVAVIIVEPSDDPPVRFRGRIWVRVGPRRTIATQEEERRLTEKLRSKIVPFDLSPNFFASINDLDGDLFYDSYLSKTIPSEIIAQNHRTFEQQLMALRFMSGDSPPKPTNLGILVIGKDPRYFIPYAYIQFIRFDGIEMTDPIKSQEEIDGPLPEMVKELDRILDTHISIALTITTQSTDIRQPDYPLVALQQLARNALLHRTYEGTHAPIHIYWYADRVEIRNPGGPFGQVNRQNFGMPGVADYRNLHLAEAMKNLGHIQRFGVGILLAQKALARNGNPPAEFEVQDTSVQVIVRKRL